MNTPELTLNETIEHLKRFAGIEPGFFENPPKENLIFASIHYLSLARLQIESQGVTEGKLAPSNTSGACALPAHSDVVPVCANCGQTATCFGAYEGDQEEEFCCDDCCAHGNEYGHCSPVSPPIHTEESPSDTMLLDWLESQSKASSTGISFDYVRYVEDGQVLEKGYRFMRRHFLGERKDTLRSAIKAAMEQEK